MKQVKKLYALLTPKERSQAWILVSLMIGTGSLEAFGIASIMPFLAVLSEPSMINRNALLKTAYEFSGAQNETEFLSILAIVTFLVIISAAVIRSITLYFFNRYLNFRNYSLSVRLLEHYLGQPYQFFITHHTSELVKNVVSESGSIVQLCYRPMFTLISYATTLLAIVVLLLILDPVVALLAGLFLGAIYAGLFVAIRSYLLTLGARRLDGNRNRFRFVTEVLNGIKIVKIRGSERTYVDLYREPTMQMVSSQAIQATVSQLPKFSVEAIGIGGILLICILKLQEAGGVGAANLGDIIPVLGLYAFAGYRLLPALQNIYQSIAELRYGLTTLDDYSAQFSKYPNRALPPPASVDTCQIQQSIGTEGLTFIYPETEATGLFDVSVNIPVGSFVGIVGASGAGKSTFIDLLLGLLSPDKGAIMCDGIPVQENETRSWQQNFGYVPQDIFLSDTTAVENIALGEASHMVSMNRAIECAKLANIHETIEQLENGYHTVIGERGVKLSGGQRQRLGIARALYHDPQVIVFDEATSALDNQSERLVMEAIDTLSQSKTTLVIAHRLTTVKNADIILYFDSGKLVDVGTLKELASRNSKFRAMTQLEHASTTL